MQVRVLPGALWRGPHRQHVPHGGHGLDRDLRCRAPAERVGGEPRREPAARLDAGPLDEAVDEVGDHHHDDQDHERLVQVVGPRRQRHRDEVAADHLEQVDRVRPLAEPPERRDREHPADLGASAEAREAQRAQHGEDQDQLLGARPAGRELGGVALHPVEGDDERHLDHARGQQGQDPEGRPGVHHQRDAAAEQDGDVVHPRDVVVPDQPQHRGQDQRAGDRPRPRGAAERDTDQGQQHEAQQRPDEVELLLDADGPGLREVHEARRELGVEGEEPGDRLRTAGRLVDAVPLQEQDRAQQGGVVGRGDAEDAAHPEAEQRDAARRGLLAQQQRGDQEAGQHEEHVHAEPTTGEHRGRPAEVEPHDGEGRDGPDPVEPAEVAVGEEPVVGQGRPEEPEEEAHAGTLLRRGPDGRHAGPPPPSAAHLP
ncbi:hypothetical protein Q9S36_30760 [Microbacterium sp. ARD31]|nr:hypothetical protein [Microbacterium sp. ARD31]MDT0184575.1 hypothetical protein [Microbacterium sp. ARD31]